MLVDRIAGGLEGAARFRDTGVVAPARPDSPAAARAVVDQLIAAGVDPDAAPVLTQSWLTVDEWLPALLLPLQHKAARRALPQRERLTAAAGALDAGHWLYGLLLVLDDEELVVVHRATGTVYALTISGIGDVFQLRTLLAATLPGVADPPPRPEWVAAATDGLPADAPRDPARAHPRAGRGGRLAADGRA